jgi:hypothetical protein
MLAVLNLSHRNLIPSAVKLLVAAEPRWEGKPCIYRGELIGTPLNAMMRSTSPLESRIRISPAKACAALRMIDCLILLQKDRLNAGPPQTHPAISPIPLPSLRFLDL